MRVSFSWPSGVANPAFRDRSFEFSRSNPTILVGRNGSGKSLSANIASWIRDFFLETGEKQREAHERITEVGLDSVTIEYPITVFDVGGDGDSYEGGLHLMGTYIEDLVFGEDEEEYPNLPVPEFTEGGLSEGSEWHPDDWYFGESEFICTLHWKMTIRNLRTIPQFHSMSFLKLDCNATFHRTAWMSGKIKTPGENEKLRLEFRGASPTFVDEFPLSNWLDNETMVNRSNTSLLLNHVGLHFLRNNLQGIHEAYSNLIHKVCTKFDDDFVRWKPDAVRKPRFGHGHEINYSSGSDDLHKASKALSLVQKIIEQAETSLPTFEFLPDQRGFELELSSKQKKVFNSILDKAIRLIEEHEINPFQLLYEQGWGYFASGIHPLGVDGSLKEKRRTPAEIHQLLRQLNSRITGNDWMSNVSLFEKSWILRDAPDELGTVESTLENIEEHIRRYDKAVEAIEQAFDLTPTEAYSQQANPMSWIEQAIDEISQSIGVGLNSMPRTTVQTFLQREGGLFTAPQKFSHREFSEVAEKKAMSLVLEIQCALHMARRADPTVWTTLEMLYPLMIDPIEREYGLHSGLVFDEDRVQFDLSKGAEFLARLATAVRHYKAIQNEPGHMPSGFRNLLAMAIHVAGAGEENAKQCVLFIDEPEISLHIEWQRVLVTLLGRILKQTRGEESILMFATHSPDIITDHLDSVVDLSPNLEA